MISSPFSKNQGKISTDFVMNLDIAPTLLDFAGIKIPVEMQGASMKPLVNGETVADWRKEVYYHYYEKSFGLAQHYGIRTDRYKLIHYYDPIDSWELFDLKTDSTEMSNLINLPDKQSVVSGLKNRIKELQAQYNDDIGK
jgi:arylsulfatase A-like enzyme